MYDEHTPDPLYHEQLLKILAIGVLIGLLRFKRTYRLTRLTMTPLAAAISAAAHGAIWTIMGVVVVFYTIGGYLAWTTPSIPFSL